MRRVVPWSYGVVLSVAMLPALAGTPDVPVLSESPVCGAEKLGVVEIEIGTRVTEYTQGTDVPLVDYDRAMRRLSDAAESKGGNAVVLRSHQAVYFTRFGRQSHKPVYVKLRGAAIRMPDATQCSLRLVDVDEMEARSRSGKIENIDSRKAYAEAEE